MYALYSVPKKLREKDQCKFKVSLSYKATTHCLKKNKNKTHKKPTKLILAVHIYNPNGQARGAT